MKDKMKILIRLILIITICSFTWGVCIWADSYSSMLEPAGVLKDTYFEDLEKCVPAMILHKLEDDGWRWALISKKEMAERAGKKNVGGLTFLGSKMIYLMDDENYYESISSNYVASDDADGVFSHEVGHAMAGYLDDSDISAEFREIYSKTFKKEYVSEYANTSNVEAYAEVFCFLTVDSNTVLENAPTIAEYVLRDARTMMEMR